MTSPSACPLARALADTAAAAPGKLAEFGGALLDTPPRHSYDYLIDRHGDWYCEGNPVADPRLFRLLSRSLFERDGGFFIRCEGEVHPVRVADAPLWVRYVHVRTDRAGSIEAIEVELTDGRREPLAADTVTVAGNDALYCRVTPKQLKARFGKVAYYEIARYLHEDPATGGFFLVICGRRYPVGRESASPADSHQ